MAQAPTSTPTRPDVSTPPASGGPGTFAPPTPAHPGGMASDPVGALANEIVTNIRGAPDRLRSQIESTPALKSLFDQANENVVAEIAQSIRRFVDAEVAKATGGLVPSQGKQST
jgi:hypothetical protein